MAPSCKTQAYNLAGSSRGPYVAQGSEWHDGEGWALLRRTQKGVEGECGADIAVENKDVALQAKETAQTKAEKQ